MREPPPHVTDRAVLAVVRDRWLPDADEVAHLPVGFGAWHWRVSVAGEPRLFVTLDGLGGHHDATGLEATYAAAAELAATLDFVVAPLPGPDGRLTAGLGEGALSATPWLAGSSGDGRFRDPAHAGETARLLARLHTAEPPASLVRWRPLVGPDVPELLAARTLTPWTSGPHGEEARLLLRDRLDDVAGWVADYLRLAASTGPDTWVPTHGEPHTRNQLEWEGRTLLVDWESTRLAPAERDLRWLLPHDPGDADPDLLRLFDLEWRLDEVTQYADRFESAHVGTDSDRVALGDLRHELERPDG